MLSAKRYVLDEVIMFEKKIGIIGCGNMGEAIFSRLAQTIDKSTSLMVSEMDANKRAQIQDKYKVIVEIDNSYLVKYSDVIIIAVKPKDFDNILREEICCGISEAKLLISIAAGITTGYIESIVGKDVPVIRVMPNMAAVIGEAMSSMSPGGSATGEHMKLAREIFSRIGDVIEVDEDLVDSITAISGSGPAYFFYFVEALIESAKGLGMDSDMAKKVVLKTILGSAKLLDILKEEPGDLIKRVASKGGTTEAAIKVFESKRLKSIIKDACREAQKRSKALSRR